MSIDGLFPQFGDNLSLHPPGDSIQGQSTPEGMRQLLEELSLAPEPQKSYKGKEKADTMAEAEAEAEDEAQADASQRPSTLGGSHETEREVDIAAMVTLGCQVVLMAGERSHASKQLQQTNSLLAALEVPRHLHFSADLSGSHARIVRIYMWVQRYRGEFSAAIYNLCLSLTFVGHATEECEAMAVHRRALESFLDQAESRFRPDFVKKWRTALPTIYGDQKSAETVKLVELLGQETQCTEGEERERERSNKGLA